MSTVTRVLVDHPESGSRLAVLTLNRPEARNALDHLTMMQLTTALAALDRNDTVGAILIRGSDRFFSVGADVAELAGARFPRAHLDDLLGAWDLVGQVRKPLIAAVAGHALGGGCELAMMCDVIIAAENAVFGQPEIRLGLIPGMGGSQRLARAIGKAKAMDLILTGRTIDAFEADRTGLVSRVVPVQELRTTALAVGEAVSGWSLPALLMAKESVNRAFELSLAEGIRFERRSLQSMLATDDHSEGIAAFRARRPPKFVHA